MTYHLGCDKLTHPRGSTIKEENMELHQLAESLGIEILESRVRGSRVNAILDNPTEVGVAEG